MRGSAEDRLPAAADEMHAPGILGGERVRADPVAVLRAVVARADDRDGGGREQGRQIARRESS
jgi:hypothetical protein